MRSRSGLFSASRRSTRRYTTGGGFLGSCIGSFRGSGIGGLRGRGERLPRRGRCQSAVGLGLDFASDGEGLVAAELRQADADLELLGDLAAGEVQEQQHVDFATLRRVL